LSIIRLPYLSPARTATARYWFRCCCDVCLFVCKRVCLLTSLWEIRNLVIANTLRVTVSCTHKVTTVSRSPKLPSKVTQGHRKCHGSIQRYDFLLPFHSNYMVLYCGVVLHRLPNSGGKSRKIYKPHLYSTPPSVMTVSEFRKKMFNTGKTRMIVVPYAEDSH